MINRLSIIWHSCWQQSVSLSSSPDTHYKSTTAWLNINGLWYSECVLLLELFRSFKHFYRGCWISKELCLTFAWQLSRWISNQHAEICRFRGLSVPDPTLSRRSDDRTNGYRTLTAPERCRHYCRTNGLHYTDIFQTLSMNCLQTFKREFTESDCPRRFLQWETLYQVFNICSWPSILSRLICCQFYAAACQVGPK